VLVCHPELVEQSLRAVEGRALNTAALIGLIGRGALGWDGLLADARHAAVQSRMPGPADCCSPIRSGNLCPMPNLSISEILEASELLIDRPVLDAAIARIADHIARDYIGDAPAGHPGGSAVPVFLTVMHGGLPFAGQLALELGTRGLDLQFDYLHATRYRGQNQGGELVWKHRPATPLYGRRGLLADDILRSE